MKYVIDSNVPIVANGRNTHTGVDAQLKAAKFLVEVMKTGIVLEDEEEHALNEYKTYLNFSGQPAMGDEFFAWFVRERWNGRSVQRVPSPSNGSILDLLPPALTNFDPSDHKWICIYLQGAADRIVNAADSDWAEARTALEAEGIIVLELLA